jgi:hypothetical protein
MGARDLLHDLEGAGMSVKLIDGRIIVTPKDRLTDPLRAAIRANRADLLMVLNSDVPDAPRPTPVAPFARVYRLTRTQADEAHALPWSADTIRAFGLRRDALLRRGYGNDDADDLAEQLALRDRRGDDRVLCLECIHLHRGRCGNARAAGVGFDVPTELVMQLQRCPGYGPAI